jgi:hypothetical protein
MSNKNGVEYHHYPKIIKKQKFIDMTKEIKLSPVSKRNGVKNEFYI